MLVKIFYLYFMLFCRYKLFNCNIYVANNLICDIFHRYKRTETRQQTYRQVKEKIYRLSSDYCLLNSEYFFMEVPWLLLKSLEG
jgi:hypothetical protein